MLRKIWNKIKRWIVRKLGEDLAECKVTVRHVTVEPVTLCVERRFFGSEEVLYKKAGYDIDKAVRMTAIDEFAERLAPLLSVKRADDLYNNCTAYRVTLKVIPMNDTEVTENEDTEGN